MKKRLLLTAPVVLGVLLVLCAGTAKVSKTFQRKQEKIITSSALTDAVDISELSIAQFTYNGIAEKYKDSEQKKVLGYIRYNARVKAGIDMKEISFEIDDASQKVRPILPEIKISANLLDDTPLTFIPKDANIDLKEARDICRKDVEREAGESPQLMQLAEENLRAIVEALLYPVLNSQGYQIVWE